MSAEELLDPKHQHELESPLDTPEPDPDNTTTDANGQIKPMSKKAMKKAAKAERYQAFKLERRAREKQMHKEKKKLKAQKRAAGELDDSAELEEKARKKRKMSGFGGRVVLDMGFDTLMSEKEINSLCSQLAYTYSANRNASYPFSLLYTSVDGKTRDRLEAINNGAYKRWSHTEWWHDSYERLWSSPGASTSTLQAQTGESFEEAVAGAEPDVTATGTKQTIVYLTADSGEELEELRPDETYIIGALVDRNRYKNITLDKANTQSIRHARLPIGKYISSLPTRKVLTVNQVFEIMLKWVETRDWELAFNSIIPKRKFLDGGKKGKRNGEASVEGDGEEQDEQEIGHMEAKDEDVESGTVLLEEKLPDNSLADREI